MDEKLRNLERLANAGDSEAAERLEREQARAEPAWKTHWRKKDKAGLMVKTLCQERGYSFETHSAHGFYVDVVLNGQRYMLDPTPDNIWREGKLIKSYPPGLVFVRDSSHTCDNPTQLAEFNIIDDENGFEQFKEFLTSLESA